MCVYILDITVMTNQMCMTVECSYLMSVFRAKEDVYFVYFFLYGFTVIDKSINLYNYVQCVLIGQIVLCILFSF